MTSGASTRAGGPASAVGGAGRDDGRGAGHARRARRARRARSGLHGLPAWVLVPALVGALLVVLPVAATAGRAVARSGATDGAADGGTGFLALVTSPAALDALGLSLRTSLAATAACVVLGVPMALVLARATFPGRRVARALVLLPLVLPPVVGGVALLTTFGRRGVLGPVLGALGVQLPFTTAAVVVAQTFVALPFLVLTLEGALRSHDTRLEDVAATLGARPTRVLARVTLPRVLPALASGTVLAFARALGEFGATLTFAGSLQGVTQTLPLEIYLQRSADPDAAVALSLVLVVVALVIIVVAHGPWSFPTGPGGRSAADDDGPPGEHVAVGESGVTGDGDGGDGGDRGESPARPPAGAPALPLTVAVRAPARGVDAAVTVRAGEVVALVGPNGAGKSTLVEAVAGLLDPGPRGAVTIRAGDRVLTDTAARTRVPPRARRVGWMGQRPLLLEHLRVVDDVGFGPRSRGAARDDARRTARDRLGAVGAAHLAGRRSGRLSGGQAQRVALARVLATDPEVLLLDEPFAALDVTVAQQLRAVLAAEQRRRPRTTLLVTHDLLDVVLLADRVVVVEGGRVVEDAPVDDALSRPRSAFAARLAGVDLLAGTVTAALPPPAGPRAQQDVEVVARTPAGDVHGTAAGGTRPGDAVVAVFAPQAVAVHRRVPEGSPRNAFRVTVEALEPHGPLLRVRGRTTVAPLAGQTDDDAAPLAGRAHVGGAPLAGRAHVGGTPLAADLTPGAAAELRLAPGEEVWFVVKTAEVTIHPAHRPAPPAG